MWGFFPHSLYQDHDKSITLEFSRDRKSMGVYTVNGKDSKIFVKVYHRFCVSAI